MVERGACGRIGRTSVPQRRASCYGGAGGGRCAVLRRMTWNGTKLGAAIQFRGCGVCTWHGRRDHWTAPTWSKRTCSQCAELRRWAEHHISVHGLRQHPRSRSCPICNAPGRQGKRATGGQDLTGTVLKSEGHLARCARDCGKYTR